MKKIIIEPTLEERHLDGYYFVKFFCRNCNNSSGICFNGIDVMIKKGTEKPTKLICPNCNCLENF